MEIVVEQPFALQRLELLSKWVLINDQLQIPVHRHTELVSDAITLLPYKHVTNLYSR